MGSTDRFLCVSDYQTMLGGIETTMHTMTAMIATRGYETRLCGWAVPPQQRYTTYAKHSGLLLSHHNLIFARQFRRLLDTYRPTWIWLHSVSRYIGPTGLVPLRDYCTRFPNTAVWMMYHDFGYIHPFAQYVYSPDDIPSRDISSFVAAAGSSLPKRLYARAKFAKLDALRAVLDECVTCHLAPSSFLATLMQDRWGLDRVDVLPHCYLPPSGE